MDPHKWKQELILMFNELSYFAIIELCDIIIFNILFKVWYALSCLVYLIAYKFFPERRSEIPASNICLITLINVKDYTPELPTLVL